MIPPEHTSLPEIPKELTEKVQALRCLATTHALLNKGLWTHSAATAVQQSMEFLSILHGQLVEEALAHPDADKVEELKALKEKQS